MKKPLKKGQLQRGLKPTLDQIDDADEKGSLLDDVEDELEEDGIVLFDNENVEMDYLRLPPDLTEEPSKELGKYFTAFTQQKMWTRTLLGRTSAILREYSEELDEIKDCVFSELPTKMSVTEKQLKLRSHFRYGKRATELLDDVARLEEKRNMLGDYLENLVDGITCISREITRREGDWKDETRGNSVDSKRRNR